MTFAHYQDLQQFAYKHSGGILLTCDGVQKFAKESHSPNAIKHKEDILALIHRAQAQLQATTTVETHPNKKQLAAATKINDASDFINVIYLNFEPLRKKKKKREEASALVFFPKN
jgi:hypothetical protein